MTTCFVRISPRRGDKMRATTSEALPAGNGTTKVTGLVGHAALVDVCAVAGNDANANISTASKMVLGTSPPLVLIRTSYGSKLLSNGYGASINLPVVDTNTSGGIVNNK
jgi:hypothetical protein